MFSYSTITTTTVWRFKIVWDLNLSFFLLFGASSRIWNVSKFFFSQSFRYYTLCKICTLWQIIFIKTVYQTHFTHCVNFSYVRLKMSKKNFKSLRKVNTIPILIHWRLFKIWSIFWKFNINYCWITEEIKRKVNYKEIEFRHKL